jgi:hypothetical protein
VKSTTADAVPASLLARVVEHYHRTFCASRAAQAYLTRRGRTNPDLLKACRIGYADGSLLKRIPRTGDLREELRALGVITEQGRELLGGCIVVPIPDPQTGAWTTRTGAACGRRAIATCRGRCAASGTSRRRGRATR